MRDSVDSFFERWVNCYSGSAMKQRVGGFDSSSTLDGRNDLITSVTRWVLGWLVADGGVSVAGTVMVGFRRR